MINILYTILIVFMTSIKIDFKQDIKINQNAKASVSNSVQDKLDKREKILKFIKLVQPKFTNEKVIEINDAIFKYSNQFEIDPFLVASVAYCESEFNMRSKPCIGIMQLVRSSIRFYDPKKEYNPYSIDGNIAIGCLEISKHFQKYTKYSSLPSRSTTRNVLLRYNGSKYKYTYAIKVLRVKNRLCIWDINKIRDKLKKNSLWNE